MLKLSYMESCIFCKIIEREPDHIIYQDDSYIVFLDINPRSPGHCLIVPKQHYRWVWDVPNVGEYFEIAKKIAKAQMKAFETDCIISHVEGLDVPHAHIWVYPNSKVQGDPKDFQTNANKIKENL